MNVTNLINSTILDRDTICKQFESNHTISYAHSHEIIEESIGKSLHLYGYDIIDVCVNDIQGQKYIVLSYDPCQDNNGKGELALTAKEVWGRVKVTQDILPIVLRNMETGEYEPVVNWKSDRLGCFLFGIHSPKL